MSTKSLRSVLALMREDKFPQLTADAEKELEAIEKAAKEFVADNVGQTAVYSEEFMALQESIAKDAQ